MNKVISFSLWGANPQYVLGAILNVDIAEKMWPDWKCRFYVAPTVPEVAIAELQKRSNVEIITKTDDIGWNGMFWRFLAAGDPNVDVMISRDADSRLNVRDKACVDEWLDSGKSLHIIRDNCQHGWLICGGAWGIRKGPLANIENLIIDYLKIDGSNSHGVDQRFLSKIYPYLVGDSFTHDEEFPAGKHPMENKHNPPIRRLKGDGWWKQDFPEWHSGIEDDKENYPGWQPPHGPGHCFLQCPACNKFHDNDYIGKQRFPNNEEKKKYSHVMEAL